MKLTTTCAMMMAAVLPAALAAQDQHPPVDDHHAEPHAEAHPDHGGPGPHFMDAFFIENAFIATKIRPDLAFTSVADGSVGTGSVEVEWGVGERFSLIAHAPYHRMVDLGHAERGLGDLGVGGKVALINRPGSFILSGGAKLEIATGDAARHLGHGYWAAEPFLFAWVPFGPEKRFSFQSAALVKIPFDRLEQDQAEIGAALTWTSPIAVTPVLEAITEFEFAHVDPSWWIAPGFRFPVASGWEIGASFRLPVAGPTSHEEDYRFVFGLVRVIRLPH